MPLGDFVEAGTIPKPLIIGRMGRVGLGAFLLFVFIVNLIDYEAFTTSDISDPDVFYWIAVAVSWWYFSDLVVVGFSREWGRWSQAAIVLLAVPLVVAGLLAYDSAWAPPLSFGVFVFTESFFGALSVSLLLAAVFAVPG